MPIGRRSFLVGSIGAIGLGGLTPLRSAWATAAPEAHTLSLYNIHTSETLKVAYREQGPPFRSSFRGRASPGGLTPSPRQGNPCPEMGPSSQDPMLR